jgi:hypothetical protein
VISGFAAARVQFAGPMLLQLPDLPGGLHPLR